MTEDSEKDRHKFAATTGRDVLYKFRAFRTPKQRQRVSEILRDHKAYFSRSSQLNDPFDLYPRFEPASRDQLIAAAEAFFERRPDRADRERTIAHLKTCNLEEHIAWVDQATRQRLEDYWVFSLAGNRDHPMLWSHYAAGHTGLCIHFRADGTALFGKSIKVEYQVERPSLPIDLRSISERQIFGRTVLTKGKFWEYEDEYRWIRLPHTEWAGVRIRFEGQHGYFRARELAGITVGTRMPGTDVAELCDIAITHAPALPVWRAVEQRTFELAFERIA